MPNPASWASEFEPFSQAVANFVDPSTGAQKVVNTGQPLPAGIYDPTAGVGATVTQFHNIDNQALGAGNGVYTGGVAQLLNTGGNLDRQRETGIDSIPATGIATGAAQFAMAFLTTDSTDNFAAGTRTFTPVAMSGVIQGVPWSIQVGSILTLDSGANAEVVVVTAVAATTFTAVTTKAHNGTTTPFNVAGFVYNQERDASGELDGASGSGTAIAAEYEYNGGGPATNAGLASNLSFDRGRNLQSKGFGSATQNAGGAAGALSITVSSAAATNTLQAGQQIRIDRNTGNDECAYVAKSYVPGTAAIPLQSALAFTHTTATVEWDIFASAGPGLTGFNPAGIGIEEEAIFNSVDGKYYIQRSASADAAAVANLPFEAPGLYNGASFDRQRGNVDTAALINAAGATTSQTGADQTNYNGRGLIVVLNMATVGTGSVTLTIQGKDAASGQYYTLLAGAAVVTNSVNVYTVYPAATVTANVSANFPLPRTWRVITTANNANATTYTVGASVIV